MTYQLCPNRPDRSGLMAVRVQHFILVDVFREGFLFLKDINYSIFEVAIHLIILQLTYDTIEVGEKEDGFSLAWSELVGLVSDVSDCVWDFNGGSNC